MMVLTLVMAIVSAIFAGILLVLSAILLDSYSYSLLIAMSATMLITLHQPIKSLLVLQHILQPTLKLILRMEWEATHRLPPPTTTTSTCEVFIENYEPIKMRQVEQTFQGRRTSTGLQRSNQATVEPPSRAGARLAASLTAALIGALKVYGS